MSAPKITCVACGVFQKELEVLANQGRLTVEIRLLESMLHMKPACLEKAMERVILRNDTDKYVILYGDCHPRMHEMQGRQDVEKIPGMNCCEILLGKTEYRKLQKENAFIFLPEWTLRWKEIFSHELGFEKSENAQAFMKDHLSRLVYIDTGVMPIPRSTISDIEEYFDMPVEIMHIALDNFLNEINRSILKLNANPES